MGIALLQLGCTGEVANELDVEEVAFDEQAIEGGTNVPVGSRFAKSTVAVDGCTGTIISPRHVLSAAHCGLRTQPASIVRFYDGSTLTGETRTVLQVFAPYGVSATDTTDDQGKFADWVVL